LGRGRGRSNTDTKEPSWVKARFCRPLLQKA